MNEETLFHAAQSKPAGERAAFLDQACGSDSGLRRRVETLLHAHDNPGSFMDSPAAELAATRDPLGPAGGGATEPAEGPGALVGDRYRLLERIGEGGMGVVFMAQQTQPVRRKVALKVIKAGMDSAQVVARFEAERQALALMDHPNIAKVLDGGATGSGRPYFVMELVQGVPITDYCDQTKLTARQRLELFLPVCRAVQHAHTKGIIHRDLKPSNVLVTLADGVPVPKVIDFGVAKATGQALTDRTLFTQFAQMVGTPLYMSPEQAGSGLDVDTRSDVYSLGVLLYELLTGTTPFDKGRLGRAALEEVRRIIREEEPPKPSTRLSTMLGEALTSVSASRQTDSKRLGRLVRGELDWIVMRALEKDRTRRYETTDNLARDVERYLAGQPVEACPPSRVYRLRKFAGRNRVALVTAVVIAVTLAVATTVSSWQAVRATRAKAAAIAEKQRADHAAATATDITEYLQRMIRSAERTDGKGNEYTVRKMLDEFVGTFEGTLVDRPDVEASLQRSIGLTYRNLGDDNEADKHLTRAMELQRRVYGNQSQQYADALVDCAFGPRPFGGGQSEARQRAVEAQLREALIIYRTCTSSPQRVLGALHALKHILGEQGNWREEVAVAEQGLALAREFPELAHQATADWREAQRDFKWGIGDDAGAEEVIRQILQEGGPDDYSTGMNYLHLGTVLTGQDKFSEALEARRNGLAILRRIRPADHPSIGNALRGVTRILHDVSNASSLSKAFPTADKLSEIEALYRPSLASNPAQPGMNPALMSASGLASLADTYAKVAREYLAAGKVGEGQVAKAKASALLNGLLADCDGNPDLLAAAYPGLIVTALDLGRPDDAKEMLGKLAALKPKDAEPLNEIAWSLVTFVHLSREQAVLAVKFAEQAVDVSPGEGNLWNTLGVAYYRAGYWQKAVEALRKSRELSRDQRVGVDGFFLAMAHWQLGHKDEARQWYDRAVAWMDKNQPQKKELRRLRAVAEALIGAQSAATTSPAHR